MRELTLKEKIIYFFKDRIYYIDKALYKSAVSISFGSELDFPPSFCAKHTPEELKEIRAQKLQELCDVLEEKNDV